MIKQNLLLNKGTNVTEVGDFELESTMQGTRGEQKESVVKILTILLFVALLYAYESYNLGVLNDQMVKAQKQVQRIDSEISKYGNVSEEAANHKKKKDELELKKKVIRDLARSRITALKALDFIQNIIPTKVWLNTLRLENDILTFEGNAITEEELNEFLSQLERRKNYFTDVIMEKAEDRKTKQGVVKAFIISSKLVVEN